MEPGERLAGLPRNFYQQGLIKTSQSTDQRFSGKGAILAGSCSGTTRTQIEHHEKNKYATFKIEVKQVMYGEMNANVLIEFIENHTDALPLVYSSSAPDEVKLLQKQFGVQAVADALDNLFATTASDLVCLGYERLVIAGGETSSAVAIRLSEQRAEVALHIGREIDPGVPVLSMGTEPALALALKSGNFGGVDFFEKAFSVMSGNDVH